MSGSALGRGSGGRASSLCAAEPSLWLRDELGDLFSAEVEIGAYGARREAVRRVEQIDLLLRHRMARQECAKPACAQRFGGEERRKLGDEFSGQRPIAQMQVVVRRQKRKRLNPLVAESPDRMGVGIAAPACAWEPTEFLPGAGFIAVSPP